MSLNWNVVKIKNHEKVTTHPLENDRWHPVTEALVWLALRCDFQEISEKNVDEVYRRIAIDEMTFGPQLTSSDGKSYRIRYQDVVDHIGLWTNVGERTFKQYLSKIGRVLDSRARDQIARDKASGESVSKIMVEKHMADEAAHAQ